MTDAVEIENFLSVDECNKLIELHKKFVVNYGKIHNETEVLNLMFLVLNDSEDEIFIKYIHGKITAHIKAIDQSSFINYFEVVKWKQGLKMEKHFDFDFHLWTSVIYLNDDYEGGETIVDEKKIIPLKGKIVTFKGSSLLHGVNKILKGDRYTVPVWYRSA